jgi:para-nitrobenzyl esterase
MKNNEPGHGDTEVNAENAVKVMCRNGNMAGTKKNGVFAFRGIPYAKPPVGGLRWKAPVEPDASTDDVNATNYGYSAIQTEWLTEDASYREQSEDCLTLNIWTKSPNTDAGKPVMVFIHGGAYGWGGTGDPLYDGQNFAEINGGDIVFVTINYRLGIIGFIDFSSVEGGEAYEDAPNLGLLDQIQALKWIQGNITQFGGDPGCVTIFGESAGGGSVSCLMIMDAAKGLFRRCIAESGSSALTSGKEQCRAQTEVILGITGAKSMDDLLAMTEDDLKELNGTIVDDEGKTVNDLTNMPQRDGKWLPDTVEGLYEAYLTTADNDVDFMTGTMENEWNYWIGEMMTGDPETDFEEFTEWMNRRYKEDTALMSADDKRFVEAFMAAQEGNADNWKVVELYNELAFRIPACEDAKIFADSGGKSYMYYWKYPSAIKRYGACHAVELAYVFGNLDDTVFTGDITDSGKTLAAKTQEAWVNFAVTGDPSIEGVAWPAYDSNTRMTMIIDDDWKVESDPLVEQRRYIEPLLRYGIR